MPAFKSRILGFLASWCGPLSRRHPVTREDLKRADTPTSMQRLGLCFTEKVRDVFRFRWIKY
jgi:hypothetical protein